MLLLFVKKVCHEFIDSYDIYLRTYTYTVDRKRRN